MALFRKYRIWMSLGTSWNTKMSMFLVSSLMNYNKPWILKSRKVVSKGKPYHYFTKITIQNRKVINSSIKIKIWILKKCAKYRRKTISGFKKKTSKESSVLLKNRPRPNFSSDRRKTSFWYRGSWRRKSRSRKKNSVSIRFRNGLKQKKGKKHSWRKNISKKQKFIKN